MTYKKLIIAALLFLFSVTLDSFSIIKYHDSGKQKAATFISYDDNWVLEYIDGSWWWVLYDTDGVIIRKIPYDF